MDRWMENSFVVKSFITADKRICCCCCSDNDDDNDDDDDDDDKVDEDASMQTRRALLTDIPVTD